MDQHTIIVACNYVIFWKIGTELVQLHLYVFLWSAYGPTDN